MGNFSETITGRLNVNATGGGILSITYLYQYVCEPGKLNSEFFEYLFRFLQGRS